MTTHTPKGSSSILQGGKLKSGIYKIQNVYTETYVDIETHSRSVCCRPAENLEEGNGLVRLFPHFLVRVYLTITSGRSSLLGLDILYGG